MCNQKLKNAIILTAVILLLAQGCSFTNTISSAKGKILGESSIEVLTDNVMLDGEVVVPGDKVNIKAGKNEIVFYGEVVRKVPIANQNKSGGGATNNAVGCLLFLPICILSGLATSSDTIVKNIKSLCTAKVNIVTEPGHIYSIRTKENSSNAPLLVVSRLSSPSFDLIEEIMECEDVEI